MLNAIQVKYQSAEKEIACYIPQIQDLEFTVFELRSAVYAKDKELIAAYNQASIGEVVGDVGAQAGAAKGEVLEVTAAENVAAVEGVTTK
ncbi:hypothetical protein ACFX13_033037 [Malus domestica]